ncbi:hypothetical protein NE865_09950 [Phthorimaea operculella]|nr:hypothetical protein NE865_09950 [Phthorimaea operculella]
MRCNLAGRVLPAVDVYADDVKLQEAPSMRLLGFELDSGLRWDLHIDGLCVRLGRACYALRRLAATVSVDVVRACYFATVHSLLTYGTELWARAADRERAFVMQKRAVRAMARVPDDESARPYFTQFGIITLPSILIYQVAVFTHENLNLFERIGDGRTRVTRYGSRLRSVPHRLAKSTTSVYVLGPSVYNRLPERVTSSTSLPSFKNCLRTWLLEEQFYDVNDLLDKPVRPADTINIIN